MFLLFWRISTRWIRGSALKLGSFRSHSLLAAACVSSLQSPQPPPIPGGAGSAHQAAGLCVCLPGNSGVFRPQDYSVLLFTVFGSAVAVADCFHLRSCCLLSWCPVPEHTCWMSSGNRLTSKGTLGRDVLHQLSGEAGAAPAEVGLKQLIDNYLNQSNGSWLLINSIWYLLSGLWTWGLIVHIHNVSNFSFVSGIFVGLLPHKQASKQCYWMQKWKIHMLDWIFGTINPVGTTSVVFFDGPW